jgi:hypothetical protein
LVEFVGAESEAYCLTAYPFDLAAREVLLPRFFQGGHELVLAGFELVVGRVDTPEPVDAVAARDKDILDTTIPQVRQDFLPELRRGRPRRHQWPGRPSWW